MHRILLALRIFFRILFDADSARRVEQVLGPADTERGGAPPPPKASPGPDRTPSPARGEALTLLATLQREARFLDFIKESLGGYTDAQIGAVARDIHRDCGAVVERLFAVRALVEEPEGAPIEVPAGYDNGRYRLTGQVTGNPPFSGQVVHHGWQASRSELPTWSGRAGSIHILAPVEVEIRS